EALVHHASRFEVIGRQRVDAADLRYDLAGRVDLLVVEQQVAEHPGQRELLLLGDRTQAVPQLGDRRAALARLVVQARQRQVQARLVRITLQAGLQELERGRAIAFFLGALRGKTEHRRVLGQALQGV